MASSRDSQHHLISEDSIDTHHQEYMDPLNDRPTDPYSRHHPTFKINGAVPAEKRESMSSSKDEDPTKRRDSRTGTRNVSQMSIEQLERKRANDREAQRSIRQRTKEHIEQLEHQVSLLLAQVAELRPRGDRLDAVEQNNVALQDEVNQLKLQLSVLDSDEQSSKEDLKLRSNNTDLNSSHINEYGRTPLSWAAENRDQAKVRSSTRRHHWATRSVHEAVTNMILNTDSTDHPASNIAEDIPKAPGDPKDEPTSELAATANPRPWVQGRLCRKMYGLLSRIFSREESIPDHHLRFRWINASFRCIDLVVQAFSY